MLVLFIIVLRLIKKLHQNNVRRYCLYPMFVFILFQGILQFVSVKESGFKQCLLRSFSIPTSLMCLYGACLLEACEVCISPQQWYFYKNKGCFFRWAFEIEVGYRNKH